MLHLIERIVPRPLHRIALRVAHKARHRWRLLMRIPLAGVSMIARDGAGRVLMVRHSYGPDTWAFPGGGCKRGEEPIEAVQREMMEELGCSLANLELVDEISEIVSGSPHTAYIFTGLVEGALRPDQREVVEARFFDLGALPERVSPLTRNRIAAWRASQQR